MLPSEEPGRYVRVIALRHGPAEEEDPVRWPDDRRRPLSEKGAGEVTRVARHLAEMVDGVGRIATSEAERALRTAEILRRELRTSPRLETWEELAPGGAPEPLFARVARTHRRDRELVLVGHEPTLSELVGVALVGEGVSVVRLARAGAACLEFPGEVRPGAGRLLWLLTRKQLAGERH